MGVEKPSTDLSKRRVAHAHVHTQRQTGAVEFIPHLSETWMAKQTIARGAVYHGSAGTQLAHLFNGFTPLSCIPQREQPGPLQSFRSRLALLAHVTVVGTKERRFEPWIGCHAGGQRCRIKHLGLDT